MEFDLATWHRDPASRWLVKLVDDRVHAGTILACNDIGVVVHSVSGTLNLDPREVDWIRPLIEVIADGWTVVTGFQAEDHTFDTWWIHGDRQVRINYSGPSGFSDLLQFTSPDDLAHSLAPSPTALAQVRMQIHRILIERQDQRVPPSAHLQG